MTIALRDYQLEMIDGTRQALRSHRRVLLQAPTGAGKTVLAAKMASETYARNKIAWFICHRAELVEQTAKTFKRFDLPHGVVAAGWPMEPSPIRVCSIDTLKNRYHLLPPPSLVIWDECHHIAAEGWKRVQSALSGAYHVGLSATPQRLDGRGLDDYFDVLVPGPSESWLIDRGYLAQYRAYAPSAPDMTGVRRQHGDFARGETERAMDRPRLTGDIIEHWRRLAAGRRTVVFAVSRTHSQHLASQFNAAGIPAAHIDGAMPRTERVRAIRDFAAGIILVLCCVDLIGEGFDLAALADCDVTIDAVVLGRPTQSRALHRQQMGRVLRPAKGKIAIILDHAGNIARHGLPDDEIAWSLDGHQSGRRGTGDNGPPPPVSCKCCYGQIRRPAPPLCPYCGAPIIPDRREIQVAEGNLCEITAEQRVAIRAALKREQSDAKTLADLVALGTRRGYKSPQQWAFKVWSNRKTY